MNFTPALFPSALTDAQRCRISRTFGAAAPFIAQPCETPAEWAAHAQFFSSPEELAMVDGAEPFGHGIGVYSLPEYGDDIAGTLNVVFAEESNPLSPGLTGAAGSLPGDLSTNDDQDARASSAYDMNEDSFFGSHPSTTEADADFSHYKFALIHAPTGTVLGYANEAAAELTASALCAALAERHGS